MADAPDEPDVAAIVADIVRSSLAVSFWVAFAAWYMQVLAAFGLAAWLFLTAVREAALRLPALLLRAWPWWQWPPL